MSTTTKPTIENAQDLQRVAIALEKIGSGELKRIAIALEAWMAMQQRGPEMEYPVARLSTFDWETIGGQVLETDDQGATLVNWMLHNWRRSTVGQDFIFERPVSQSCRAILAVFSD